MRSSEGLIEQQSVQETEAKKLYHLDILVGRHANRDPSGMLTQEGQHRSSGYGQSMTVEEMPTFASDEKSRRSVITGDLVQLGAILEPDIYEPTTPAKEQEEFLLGRHRDVVQLPNLYYTVIPKDVLKQATGIIDQKTLEVIQSQYGEDAEVMGKILAAKEPEKLAEVKSQATLSQQDHFDQLKAEVAKLREEYQPIGIEWVVEEKPDARRAMAGAFAQALVAVKDYMGRPEFANKNNRVAQLVGHGGFSESLFKEGALVRNVDGQEVRGFENLDEIGGNIKPSEYFMLSIDNEDGQPKDKLVKIAFNEPGRQEKVGEAWLDWNKVEQLAQEFKASA